MWLGCTAAESKTRHLSALYLSCVFFISGISLFIFLPESQSVIPSIRLGFSTCVVNSKSDSICRDGSVGMTEAASHHRYQWQRWPENESMTDWPPTVCWLPGRWSTGAKGESLENILEGSARLHPVSQTLPLDEGRRGQKSKTSDSHGHITRAK